MTEAEDLDVIARRDQRQSLLFDCATKAEIAREFGVSERTIERWVRMRLLPRPLKLGRTILFHLPTVQQHLAKQFESGDACRRRVK